MTDNPTRNLMRRIRLRGLRIAAACLVASSHLASSNASAGFSSDSAPGNTDNLTMESAPSTPHLHLAASSKFGQWQGKISYFGWPDEIDNARDALTLMYLRRSIYNVVECVPKEVEGFIFIRCNPTASTVPGGFYVATDAFGGVSIIPLNGKALTHSKGLSRIGDASNRPISLLGKSNADALRIIQAAPLSTAFKEFGR